MTAAREPTSTSSNVEADNTDTTKEIMTTRETRLNLTTTWSAAILALATLVIAESISIDTMSDSLTAANYVAFAAIPLMSGSILRQQRFAHPDAPVKAALNWKGKTAGVLASVAMLVIPCLLGGLLAYHVLEGGGLIGWIISFIFGGVIASNGGNVVSAETA